VLLLLLCFQGFAPDSHLGFFVSGPRY
jgi:hypothetical protein